MKTRITFSALLIAGLLLTQGALAHTETSSETESAGQPANIETIVVTTARTTAPVRAVRIDSSTQQRLQEITAKELQQQVAAGRFLPESLSATAHRVNAALANTSLVVQAGR